MCRGCNTGRARESRPPIALQIVEVRRQNLATVLAAKALGDLFLGQTCLLAGFHDHLPKCLHIDGRLLTISVRQSESIAVVSLRARIGRPVGDR
jgi:hypothetical protein